MADDKVVDEHYARTDEYREQLQQIAAEGVCPFCPDNFRWHPHPILREEGDWFITPIRENYENARLHFLLIGREHKEHFTQLSVKDLAAIRELVHWAVAEYELEDKGGAFSLRFGATEYTGASVVHLHGHLIVPEIDPETGRAKVVSFPIG